MTDRPDAGDADVAFDTGADAMLDGGGDTTLDGGGECVDDETRCDGSDRVERCVSGGWQVESTCALACEAGACTDSAANCTPGQTRCVGDTVQRCNEQGSAWLHSSVCLDGCDSGLCTGSCTPGEARCNADVRESCDTDGSGWSTDETCTLGCQRSVCVEEKLDIPGTVVELSGTHVYSGCVDISLGGELEVAAGEVLDIQARCLTISESSTITLAAGAKLRVRVSETADIEGSVGGGAEVVVDSYDSLRLSGSVSSERTILRADDLGIETGGTTSGNELNAALYGSAFTNDGTHTGVTSVMPPAGAESTTHPSGATWSLAGDNVVVTWRRPFPSVKGYYVTTDDVVPGPANADLRTTESVTIPLSEFGSGENRVRVVSVNDDSEVGTYFEEFVLRFNSRGPILTSSSHPNEWEWGGSDDVYLSWSDPDDLPADGFVGYYYAWTRQADTQPGLANGTFTDDQTLLLDDQEPGVWFFHIVGVDRLGRTTPAVSRLAVRIGPEPQMGNIAGTITDAATNEPVEATVLLNGGLSRTNSGPSGDYTFSGAVPAAADPYRVTVRALGYETSEAQVAVAGGDAQIQDFALDADPNSTASAVQLGWETFLSDTDPTALSGAMGPRGRFIWSTGNTGGPAEEVAIATTSGAQIHAESTLDEYYAGPRMEVGWSGEHFYAIDVYQCETGGSLNYGRAWSCLQMRSWDQTGDPTSSWLRWRNSGHTGAASAAFNGTSYGTFFVSYDTLYGREITSDVAFADGGSPTDHTSLSSSHGDTRQSARSETIWDGSAYAVAWSIERSSTDSKQAVYIGRWDTDLTPLLAPTEVGPSIGRAEVDLVWDGSHYHVLYTRNQSGDNAFVLSALAPDGSPGTTTVIADEPPDWRYSSLAFDGRYLLVAWEEADTGLTHLEVRRPDDHTIVESHQFEGSQPVVSVNPEIGEGVVLYVRDSQTYVRTLSSY